jgi:hypothetical protein
MTSQAYDLSYDPAFQTDFPRLSKSHLESCMCDQGIKFCSKIQSAWNRFKLNGSVGLVIMNPTQLVWVQTDVGSERYRVLFKMTNSKKKRDADCTFRTDTDVASRTTCGRSYDTWQVAIYIVGR